MIEIRQLVKRFGKQTILDHVSLRLPDGQVSVLLGPSGSGKSTLLRTINGLEPFDSGEIWIHDEIRLGEAGSPGRDDAVAAIRRQVGMVFQQFNLFPHRTVLQNVVEAPIYVLGKPRGQAESRALELLDQVGLRDKAHQWPSSLSGGQQQRVAIARALAMEPTAILFDEPTSALDPKMTAEITSVIKELSSMGQTMIIVTHAMQFARRVAKQVSVLHSGHIVETGTAEQVFDAPQHALTKSLLAQEAD
ncbi:MAG TPA: amino acid ABC transporter ATP-binding protein [Pirellulaceae bacterium]|nr:amino acid ABC transporter ATP-binding protein [Pirellulaceae bacterium]